MELKYNAKDKGTFRLAQRWKEYTPDLCIVSKVSLYDNTTANRVVLIDLPHNQYKLVIIYYILQVPIVKSIL